jgi:hypothetical protein
LAALDWSQCPDVESIPGKVSGAWVFKTIGSISARSRFTERPFSDPRQPLPPSSRESRTPELPELAGQASGEFSVYA